MKILITGGAGFLGTYLTQHFLDQGHKVVVASRDEAKHWKLQQGLNNPQDLSTRIHTVSSDISSQYALMQSVAPDVLVLAHAMKRIDTCEAHPQQALETNTLGVQRLLEYVIRFRHKNLRSVVLISTDKAANPVSVYGTTKLLAEQLMHNAATKMGSYPTAFITLRYGNVLQSTGSVIPYIKEKIERNQELALTHSDMTRFIFTVAEAVDMVDFAVTLPETGTWIPLNLASMRVRDLFEIYADKYNVPIRETGLRGFPEKLHETLNTEHEEVIVAHSKYGYLKFGKALSLHSSDKNILPKSHLETRLKMEGLL